MEFTSARIAADERARKNALRRNVLPEIKLADIYAELKNVVTDAAKAAQVEFEVERQFIFLNPATVALAQHAKALGYRVAVLSDTYFTAAQLQQLLRENDCPPSLFDAFFVSCERGKAKWNAQLYHELFQHFDIHPAELMHVGDNEKTDIQIARQLGVRSVHYYKTNPQLDRVLAAEKKLRSSDLHPAGSLDALRILTARRAESDRDAFRDGAFVFGPILSRYADWCVEKFKAANVTTVLALMREGELLGELVRRSAAAAGVELKIITCFTSRRATALASLTDLTPAGAQELLEGSATVTLQSILDVLGLGDDIAHQFDAESLRKPLPMDKSVTGLLKMLFENQRVVQLLKKGCAESHALAFDYLKSLAGDVSCVGILDIGWGGSIQRNIARILRRGGRDVRTIGCYLARTRKSGRLALDGDEIHAFMEQDWDRSTILAELAISSPIGSTNGYQRDASGVVRPVLGKCELPETDKSIRARIREGILEFQSHWLALRARKQYSADTLADIDRQTASIFYRLLDFPSKAEAERLGSLTHDENYFGENLTAPLCDDKALRQMRREGIHAVVQNSRCHWPQGILGRDNPRLIHALSLDWRDVLSLGHFGAWHGTPIGEGGVTDEEGSALGLAVHSLALRQIIFVGPAVPVLEEVLQFLWAHKPAPAESENYPRVILAGPAGEWKPGPEFMSRCAMVDGDLNELKTVQAIRALLRPGMNAGLAMSGELPANTLSGLLNGLAPFLGPQSAVLWSCGRYDTHAIAETLPAAETINDWAEENAAELGYHRWTGPATLRAQLANWIIFCRAPGLTVWNNHWMFTAADLTLAEDSGDLLLAQS